MTAEERIATLILYGLDFYKTVAAPGSDPAWRAVYHPGARTALIHIRWVPIVQGEPAREWRLFRRPLGVVSVTEAPFEPRLIGCIPETMFSQLISTFTR